MSFLSTIHSKATENTTLYFRGILFLSFLGHGLVSLGYSPGYELHYRIFESVRPTFESGGKLSLFKPVYEAVENFFFAPSAVTKGFPPKDFTFLAISPT